MKRFLIKILVVVLVLLAIMSCVDVWITRNLHHSEAKLLKSMNETFFDSTYYNIVIMGNSRGLVQYDTRIIDSMTGKNSYNLSVNGRGIVSQIIKYKAFEKRHGSPKCIIQNVDCFTLEDYNGFEREQYLPYLFDSELFCLTKNREGFSYTDRYIPLIRYAGYDQMIKEGLGIKNKMIKSQVFHGYSPNYASWNGKLLAGVKEVVFHHNEGCVASFIEYLKSCQDKGVEVIFVFSPIYSGVKDRMDEKEEKIMFETYENIASEYGIKVLSWWNSPICDDTAYFYNATHLNGYGAEKFTIELMDRLDSLYLETEEISVF